MFVASSEIFPPGMIATTINPFAPNNLVQEPPIYQNRGPIKYRNPKKPDAQCTDESRCWNKKRWNMEVRFLMIGTDDPMRPYKCILF